MYDINSACKDALMLDHRLKGHKMSILQAVPASRKLRPQWHMVPALHWLSISKQAKDLQTISSEFKTNTHSKNNQLLMRVDRQKCSGFEGLKYRHVPGGSNINNLIK